MSKRDEVRSKVIEIIRNETSVDPDREIQDGDRFEQDLGTDSLERVEVVMAVEEEFDIDTTDEESEKIRTVGDLVDFVIGATQRPVG